MAPFGSALKREVAISSSQYSRRKEVSSAAVRRVGLLAAAQALRQALRQDAEQRVGEVERVHAHVEQAR